MAKNFEEFKLHIPDDQIKRQAVASLRGYAYQIYQTLNAWLTLKDEEILLLEVAEDFAVIASAALKATQVKDTAGTGSVTLKTESVADTIKSLWQFQHANSSRDVCITYLTTSKIGKERELTFPDNQKGLTYWQVAAREGTDIEPIRRVLSELNLPPEIIDFIKNSTPDELRDRILRRIKWVCAEEDIEDLDQIIRDRLVYFGERQGFTPADSERAQDSLIVAILKKIVHKTDRQLSMADFLDTFEKAVSISLPVSQVRKLVSSLLVANQGPAVGTISAADSVLNATQVPFPPRVLDRHSLVEQLVSDMGQSGAMWLHGSSGTGKTVLARFIARQSRYNWLLVQLRDCFSASDLEFRLCRLLQSLQSSRLGGVILDDFPMNYASNVRTRLSMLVNEVHRMDGSVIVTSAKPPSPNLQGCFGENGSTVVNVPYFSRDEVAELIKLAGGDGQKWAGVVHSFCGAGHPQLVQARISGLRQRNWPNAELLAGFPGIGVSAKEIEEERESVRERLLSELLPNTRKLLYCLTLIIGYFDRELAIAVGEIEPSIQMHGEELDILLGPWIEVMANDRFRVSPLVSSAGIQTLSKPIQMEVHKRIVDNLIGRRPFPGDFLGTLLSHALISRHVQGLTWLIMAITRTPDNNRSMIAEHLFVLPLLDTSQPLFKENIHVSAMLRLAQFRVAAWANKTECLPAIADQLIRESRMIDNRDIADGFLVLVASSILMEQSLRISPQKWIPLLEELEKAMSGEGELAHFIRKHDPFEKSSRDWTTPQFLFFIRATTLNSINELIELFSELNQMELKHREVLLSSLSILLSGKRLMVDSGWLAESREGNVDGAASAEKYRRLAVIAETWGNTDIAVWCECARAIMLDEYANESDSALASLDEAEEKYPNEIRLARRRASIYYRKGDYPTALATISHIAEAIPKDDHIERAFALREAGVSAAEIRDFTKASHFFSEACGAAIAATDNMRPMAIGLKGDWAVAEFQMGNKKEAVNLMHQAVIDAEQLDPAMGKNEKYCRKILGHVLLWMQSQVRGYPVSGLEVPIVFGCCSTPEPTDEILKWTSAPYLNNWYQFAFLEIMLQMDLGFLDDLRKRTGTQRILSCELALNYYLMTKHITSVDIESFFLYLPEYLVKTVFQIEHGKDIKADTVYDFMTSEFPSLRSDDWKSKVHVGVAKEAVLALATAAACSGISTFYESLKNHIDRLEHGSAVLVPFVECFEKRPDTKADRNEVAAFYVGCLMAEEAVLTPDKMFIISSRLCDWLSTSNFRPTLENMVEGHLVKSWQKIITNQRFLLKQPMMFVPAIEDALKEPTKGVKKIAGIVLAAENAVGPSLSNELREDMKK